jgi:hypothetical protein
MEPGNKMKPGFDIGHDKLCMIQDPSQISTLSTDPTVSCMQCGVKSHDPSNVCDPVKLSGSGSTSK